MLFIYKTVDKGGVEQAGSIEAPNVDLAISSLQRRGLIIVSIKPEEVAKSFLPFAIPFLKPVKAKEIVMLSRQIATLFEAKVSVLSTFRLLASEVENPFLQNALLEITDDIKGGIPISAAMAKHPKVFSNFYVNMVRAGEESGKLSEAFTYLADYMDRTYALSSRAQNALIYPAFVVASFVVVMILMIVFVIPRLSAILLETGQELPIYTKIVIGFSSFVSTFGIPLVVLLGLLGIYLFRYVKTNNGNLAWSRFKISIPYVGALYRKLYLARIADNMNTMLSSGISMVRALEITGEVVGNEVYRQILTEAADAIKSGSSISDIFSRYEEIPGVMVQMIKVGEETGRLGFVLDKLSKFYEREVNNEVDTLVGLIEPAMIVVLGVGVGVLLTSVLVPIYNMAEGL
ncbi:MAG: type II secretion system F family protein [Candidatus Vogelbacteria bacterium]|nr:type II secretion system F family protein [Candidatus Vogelbacteria bacterium]